MRQDLNRLEKELCRLFNIRDQSDAASLKTGKYPQVSMAILLIFCELNGS